MDYKMQMQEIAELEAEERFGKDFYSLPQARQDELYSRAMDTWHDNMVCRAENAADAARDAAMGI